MLMTCGVCRWTGERPVQNQPYIAWCPGCATGLTVPPPSRDISTDDVFTAEGSYHDRIADQAQWREEAQARVAWMESVVLPGRPILELGSATGEFVEAAASRGYDITGVEPSVWAVEQAQTLTDRIHRGDLASFRAQHPQRRFACVAMFHTLEHVPEPRELLTEVREVLDPDGALLIEVPNAGTLSTDTDGTTWWMRSLEDHVHHFRPTGLARLLTECGYKPDVSEVTLQAAYSAPPLAAKARLRALVRERRLRPAADLLRVVARPSSA